MTGSTQSSFVTYKQLLYFFLPLGISATLVTLSHVIINSTLARAADPALVISSYTIALSLLGITERPAVLLRQTCSALVRDRVSFRAMSAVSIYVFTCIVLLGLLVSYTPIGEWVFLYLFGIDKEMLTPVIHVYRILMFVSIFSGIRCLYHGLIIFNMRTKWLTIGMVIRLVAMYFMSLYFVSTGQVKSGQAGAIIFLAGMMIEAAISFWEGRSLLKKVIPEKLKDHPIESKKHIFGFYKPLLYSSGFAVIIGPAINAVLGKTSDMQLAIASFAIAGSVTNLVISFFSYIHQIVLNFYRKDADMVLRFSLVLAFIPGILIAILSYTALGPWFMTHVMGVKQDLMEASLGTLRVFMLLSLIYPWLDFTNGIIMLRGQTKTMVWSQGANMLVTLLTLGITILITPGWNAMIGALAQSLGTLAELGAILYILKASSAPKNRLALRA